MFNSRKMPRVVEDMKAQNDGHPVTAPIILSDIEWPQECEAMAVCHTALARLSAGERQRAIAWLVSVFNGDE